MPTIRMVSAHFGDYTDTWVEGGYAAVGWLPNEDLTSVDSRDEIFRRYREAHPDETPHEVGANAGQLAKFILEVQTGDYIMTRCAPPTREYRYGVVENEPLCYAPNDPDDCPFPHRRKVKWYENPIVKENLSIPFQKNLSASKTLFEVRHMEEFLVAIGEKPEEKRPPYDTYRVVLDRIQTITPTEFEDLIRSLMEAMGYEGAERTGGTGDGGVDVKGVLQSNFVNVSMYVQVKHYKNRRVPPSDVKKLHRAILRDRRGGQGAIITTSDFRKEAATAAEEHGLPPVSLVNGHRLVDLLKEYWNEGALAARPEPDVPSWHERFGTHPGPSDDVAFLKLPLPCPCAILTSAPSGVSPCTF